MQKATSARDSPYQPVAKNDLRPMDLLSVSPRSRCQLTKGNEVAPLLSIGVAPLLLVVLRAFGGFVYPDDGRDRGRQSQNSQHHLWKKGGFADDVED